MKTFLTTKKVGQFKKFAIRLQKMIDNRKFEKLSRKKQQMLIARFQRVGKQLQGLLSVEKFRKLATAFAVIGALAATPAAGQVQFGTPQTPLFNISFNESSAVREPKPALVDIDSDGDLDLFLGSTYGDIQYYENTGTATAPVFGTPLTNSLGLSTVGYYTQMTFADLDGDGDQDALIGSFFGDLDYYQNTGTAAAPAFATATTNPFGLTAISPEVKPTFGDMDGDGDMDLIVGTSNADILYYENTGTTTAPAFGASQSNPFGISASGYSASPALADMDNDGDLDLFIGLSDEMRYYTNTGTSTAPAFSGYTLPANLNGYLSYNGLAVGDLDNDGDYDIIHGNDYGPSVSFVENTGTAAVAALGTPVESPFGMIFSNNSVITPQITAADIDGDGDQDFLVGSYSADFYYYENTGGNVFAAAQKNPFGIQNPGGLLLSNPTLTDIDGDGDLDLFYGDYYGGIQYAENTGTATAPAFGAVSSSPFGLTGVANAYLTSLAFADMDNDGDKDVMIGGGTVAAVQYQENTGTATAAVFGAPQTNIIAASTTTGYSYATVSIEDLDRDGDYDVMLSGSFAGEHHYYENTGTAAAPTFGTFVSNPFGLTSTSYLSFAVLVDMDGDTDIDLVSSDQYGESFFFENTAWSVNTVEAVEQESFKVFPNPAADFIQVELDEVTGETATIEILNSIGQVVFQNQVGVSGLINERLATKALETGLYIVRISTDDKVLTQTFVKQ